MTRFLREDIFEVMKAPTGDLDINFLVAYARPIISQLLEENRILREGMEYYYLKDLRDWQKYIEEHPYSETFKNSTVCPSVAREILTKVDECGEEKE